MKHNLHRAGLFRPLLLVLALLVGSGGGKVWAEEVKGTINFGNASTSTSISNTSTTGDDTAGNTWNISIVATQTYFSNSATYSQIGSSNKPATSITFTTTLPSSQTITAFSAKLGGFSGTEGTVTLKVGDTTVGTGSLNATNDVTVSSTSTEVGTVLTVTVTGIAKGVKCYSISYTYEESSSPSLTASNLALTNAPVALTFDLYNNSSAQTVSFTTSSTGAVTVSGGTDYVTTSVSGKTITVTPTAVTPSAQTITVSQAADDTYAAGSATFTVTVDDSTPTPTHTVTFSVNGSTTSSDVEEGAAITFPSNPEAVNGKVFVGWAAAAIDGTTNTAPTFVTSATMGNADVSYYAVFATLAASGEPVETKFQTLQYDTWTYSGTTTDKTSYRLFGSGSYVESAAFDLSKLSKVIVYGGTYGGATNNSLTIGDGTNTWKTVTVSGSSQTGANTYTDGTALTGTNKLRITSNSGNASSTGVRISKVEIYITESQTSYSDYCTTVVAASVEAPAINVAETFEGSNSIEATITCATEGATIYYSYDGQNWTEYTGALTITTTTTIYSKATKGSDESTVVSKTTTMTVATPTFSLAAGTYTESQSVTLACATDGATIYYTCDGDDPTTASMPYAEPIPVDAAITIKAIAVKNGVSSTVASATYTINVPSTISAVRAQGTGSVFTKGVVTSCSGTTAYIQDAAAAICVYGTAMTVGDEVTVSGTLTTYNGLMEIISPIVTVLSSGNSVLPTTKTIAEINTDYSGSNTLQGCLVKIENATVSAINNQNVTLAQGENTIVARFSSASAITCAVNDVVSLTANIGCYNAAQLANPTNVTVVQTVATPAFSPEAGTYTSAQSVTITCATEGATIYYTMDGNDPTTESMPYTEAIPVDATVTIKAIAVKEGMTNSAVATAAYTIDLTPTVTIDGLTGNAVALEYEAGARNDIHFTATNTIGTAVVTFCDSEGGALTADPDWITASIDGAYIHLTWEANDGDARTAYLKVMADNATSQVITVTQAKFVVDYATLPFEWEGGTKNALLALAGVTANGLGSDYADSNAPYRVKLDGEGDYIQIKTDSQPGVVTVGVKMIGGANTSTLTVQESSDGQTFTDVEDLTISGTQNAELSLATTNPFATTTRYVRILKSAHGSNVGVGPISITKPLIKGTADNPYTVAEARAQMDITGTTEFEAYVQGYVCEVGELNESSSVLTYYISDDGANTNVIRILRGKYLGGEGFTSENILHVGDRVVVHGYYSLYNGSYDCRMNNTLASVTPATYYTVTLGTTENCEVFVFDNDDQSGTLISSEESLPASVSVLGGTTIGISASVLEGFGNMVLTVIDDDQQPISLTDEGGDYYTFTLTSNVTISATATASACYTVILSDDTDSPITEYSVGVGVTLPERDGIGDYTFAGWSATNVSEETTTAPTIIPAGTYYPTANITLYPVYTRTEGGGETTPVTVTKTVAEFAAANNWESGTRYTSIALDANVTATGKDNGNNSKYYSTSPGTWRHYGGDSGEITVSTTSGTLSSITFSYTGNALNYGDDNVTSGTAIDVTGTSAVFSVSGSSGNTQVSGISVTYTPASAGTTYYWSTPVALTTPTFAIDPATLTAHLGEAVTVSVTTNSDMIPTSDSAIEGVSIVPGETSEGVTPFTITASQAGSYELVFSVAASETYRVASGTVALTVSKWDTNVTISTDGLATDLNLYTNTLHDGGMLSAQVLNSANEPVPGAAIVWSSSNEEVATIAETGAITLVGAGEVTFTATYAGDDNLKGSSATTAAITVTNTDPNAPGTENNPYTVAEAIAATPASGSTENVYIRGIVSAFFNTSIVGDGTSYRYYISDDGTTSTQLLIYKGKGLNNATFTNVDDLQLGDQVVLYGKLKTYSNAPEVDNGNYLISLVRKTDPELAFKNAAGEVVTEAIADMHYAFTSPTISSVEGFTGTITYASSEPTVATVDASGIVTLVAVGTTTITATFDGDDTYRAATASYELTVTNPEVAAITLVIGTGAIDVDLNHGPMLGTLSANATITATGDMAGIISSNVTWASSNTDVAIVDENGQVTGVAPGTTIITASYPGDENYGEATATHELTIKYAPTIASSLPGTAYGTPYTITQGTSMAEGMPDVVSDGELTIVIAEPRILTAEGNVLTPKAVGNTDITISTAESDNFWASETVTMNFIVSEPLQPVSGSPMSDVTTTFSELGYENSDDVTTVNNGAATMTFAQGTNSNGNTPKYYSTGSAVRMYKDNTLTIASESTITSIVFEFDGSNTTLALATDAPGELSDASDSQRTWTGRASSIQFTTSATNRIKSITVSCGEFAKLNSNGYGTYSSLYPLDFTYAEANGYSAWIVTGFDKEDDVINVRFAQINSPVTYNTGVLLKGEPNAVVELTTVENGAWDDRNILDGVSVPKFVEADQFYMLKGQTFIRATEGVVPAHKAILNATHLESLLTSPVKAFNFVFHDTATGTETIETLTPAQAEQIFDLSGRRLGKATKGINIINGKKVLRK